MRPRAKRARVIYRRKERAQIHISAGPRILYRRALPLFKYHGAILCPTSVLTMPAVTPQCARFQLERPGKMYACKYAREKARRSKNKRSLPDSPPFPRRRFFFFFFLFRARAVSRRNAKQYFTTDVRAVRSLHAGKRAAPTRSRNS